MPAVKRLFAHFVFLLAFPLLPLVAAQASPEEQYLAACRIVDDADRLSEAGAVTDALAKYQQASAALRRVQGSFPAWNTNMIGLRLSYLASRIKPLTATQEKIEALQKENASLRAALQQQSKTAQPKDPVALEQTRRALAEAQRKLDAQARAAAILIAEANVKLERKDRLASSLAAERDSLQKRIQVGSPEPNLVLQLRTENENLKRQLADSRSKVAPTGKADELGRQLKQTQVQLALAESERTTLRSEKAALEAQLKKASQPSAAAAQQAARDAARIKQLEQERDELQKKLAAASKELSKPRGKAAEATVQRLADQLAALRARLDVYEAKPVPYTPEELVLFKPPTVAVAATESQPAMKSSRTGSKINATLIADARRLVAAGELDKAEAKYAEALKTDDKDVRALSNLAALQAQQNHFDDAEKTIAQALAIDPQDATSLGLLGYLKLRQDKYDDALDALNRAAQVKPQDPKIQNLLGLTLTHKGMRGAAETAFRKALQADPNFADAHANLATVYLTQQPPSAELARWHYQRALAAGAPRNPDLEKKLEAAGPSSNPK